jgi:hypothetical protein
MKILSKQMKLMDLKETAMEKHNENLPLPESFLNIYEKIFLYLDKGSLLSCTQVCHSWNDVIVNSSRLMEKLELIVDFGKKGFTSNDKAFLARTNRQFTSVKIKHFIEKNSELKTFLRSFKWRKIVTTAQFVTFPMFSAANLENLNTFDATTLKLSHVSDVIGKSSNLKVLKVTVGDCSTSDWECFTENRNKPLKLQNLKIALNRCTPYESRQVDKILLSQVATLQELEVQGIVVAASTLKIISDMKNLKIFTLHKSFYQITVGNLRLAPMNSLKTLKIFDSYLVDQRITFPILKVAKNLVRFEGKELHQSHIEALARMEKLQELITESIQFSDINNAEFFPALDFIRIRKPMTKVQQEIIFQLVHEDLTNFKVCLYEEMVKEPHNKIRNIVLNLDEYCEPELD